MKISFHRAFFMSTFAPGKAGQLDPTEHYSLNKKSYEEENKEKE
jgi:hypothetical protein